MERSLAVLAAAVLAAIPSPARAGPGMECVIEYAGVERGVGVEATVDPYRVPAVPVEGRFLFRVVRVDAPADEAGVTVTVYRTSDPGPVPLQQATFQPPDPAAAQGPHGFTGLQRTYEPEYGRELRWWCGWVRKPPATAAAPAPVPPPAAPGGPEVTIAFVGDVMLDDLPGRALARGRDPLAAFAGLLGQADLAVANLECPIAARGKPAGKPWVFRAHPRAAAAVARHFDAVSLANNHSGDQGRDALVETLSRLRDAGVRTFGAGRDQAGAHAPLLIERNGLRIALLGFNEFLPRSFEAGPATPGVAWSEDEHVLRDIRAARAAGADVVLPVFHWGWEGEPEPSARQRDLAHRAIDAGADAVIGGHPHCTQPPEVYRGRLILHSLGNFVFDGFGPGPGREGWMLRMVVGRGGVRRWDTVVARIDARGLPSPDLDAPSPCSVPGGTGIGTCRAGRAAP